MEGVTIPLEQPFTTPAGSRLMYPGDRRLGAPAGEVVNCRCTIVGVVLEQPRFSSDDFNISAPPAKPRVQTWVPQGQPLRQALRVPRPDPYRQDSEVYELVLEAADLVRRVHGISDLQPIYVSTRELKPNVFAQYAAGEPSHLDVQLGKTEMVHVLEEFGHWIDAQAFTPGRYESIYSGDPRSPLAGWRRAVAASQAVAELRAQRRAFQTYTHVGWEANDRAFVKYLLEPEELFARSYRQFVAVHSGDPRLLQAIGNRQNTPGYEIGYNIQWEDQDFEPIADALEKVFRRLGWIR